MKFKPIIFKKLGRMNFPLFIKNNEQINYDNLVKKRSLIFSVLGLISTIIALFISLYLNFNSIAILTGCMVLALFIATLLCIKGYHELFKLQILFVINGLLALLSFAAGGKSSVFVYYFPVIIIIPFILSETKKYNRELFIYTIITGMFATISVLLPDDFSVWEKLSENDMHNLTIINASLSLTITVAITLGIIYSEKYFKDVINREKDIAQQNNRQKEILLSGCSHELRTSLNGITGIVHLLNREQHLPEQLKHFSILNNSADHMLHIVNEILELDKIESGKIELHKRPFKLKKLVYDTSIPFKDKIIEKKLSLKIEIDSTLENIILFEDDIRISQILHHLISNAVKFTQIGSIRIQVKKISGNNTCCTLLFKVEDTGVGILPDYLQKIFENFWQLYDENNLGNRGTGLGLTLTKKVLELMNSTINVESTPGKGSVFSFVLEAETMHDYNLPFDSLRTTDFLLINNKNILVAEDDPVSMTIAEKILKSNNANVFKAENGAVVLEILKINPKIDLVFLDLEMPVKNGYETITEIRKTNAKLPVVAFTATILDKKLEQSLIKQGFTSCISKPFNAAVFSTIFKNVFEE